jgi:hypothetical protein
MGYFLDPIGLFGYFGFRAGKGLEPIFRLRSRGFLTNFKTWFISPPGRMSGKSSLGGPTPISASEKVIRSNEDEK